MRRAVGIVRVSRTKGIATVSPTEQRQRIEQACEREGLELVEVIEELDVSGGTPLEKRKGLRRAVEMVESGQADVLIASYLDRLVRSVRVQLEITERVEAAGGTVLTVDLGEVNGSATKRLQAGMMGQMAQYLRETTAERTEEAKRLAIARGVPTFNRIPAGYRKRKNGTLRIDPREGPLMQEAFRRRAAGESIQDIRTWLNSQGVVGGYTRFQKALQSRTYLGELRFGEYVNPASHEPIIDRVTWERAQAQTKRRGSREKSDRLFARLGILRCATCGARLVVGQQHSNGKRYDFYRCIPQSDCPRRVTIGADLIETYVGDYLFALGGKGERPFTMTRERQTDDAGLECDLLEAEAELRAYIESTSISELGADLFRAGLEPRKARVEAAKEAIAETAPARPFEDFEVPEGLEDELRVVGDGTGLELRGEAVRELWNRLPVVGRRIVLSRVFETITVSPGRAPVEERVQVTLRQP